MPCAIPSKAISAVQYCHLDKGLCKVEGRWLKADGQMEQWTHIQSNLHPLTKAFKVTKMKKPNQNLEVPLLPFPHKQHLHSFLCFFPPLSFFFCLFRSPLPASSPWSGGRQRVSALTQRSLQELLWLAVLCSTVHNRLRHGELPLTAFLCCSCGFDTVTQTPTSPLTLQPLSSLFLFVSFTFSL